MPSNHDSMNRENSAGAPSDPNSDTSPKREEIREDGEKIAYSAPTLTQFGRLADLTGLTAVPP